MIKDTELGNSSITTITGIGQSVCWIYFNFGWVVEWTEWTEGSLKPCDRRGFESWLGENIAAKKLLSCVSWYSSKVPEAILGYGSATLQTQLYIALLTLLVWQQKASWKQLNRTSTDLWSSRAISQCNIAPPISHEPSLKRPFKTEHGLVKHPANYLFSASHTKWADFFAVTYCWDWL